jgi:hypothetical protein
MAPSIFIRILNLHSKELNAPHATPYYTYHVFVHNVNLITCCP